MSGSANRGAWADFWKSRSHRAESGCLPNALKEIDAAQTAIWQGFARGLPKRSRVLDLGTGDGAVLRKMLEVRTDLQLIGADSSPALPPAPGGITLHANVAAENLPFDAASFEMVTSQFGYEYSDTAKASTEVARVLVSGGRAAFVMHRSDGPILAHNLPRREALRWAIASGGHLEKARALVVARRTMPLPTPPAFRQAPAEAQQRFPGQTAAPEFLLAVLQTLELGRNSPVKSLEALAELEGMALNEIARIDSLERAVCDEDRLTLITDELRANGLDVSSLETLAERSSGRPFAWLLSAKKRP